MKIMQITKQGDSFILSDSNGAVAAFGFPDINAAINGAKIYGANIVYVVEVNDSIDNPIRFDWGVDLRTPKMLVYDKPCPVDFGNVQCVQCVECYGPPEYTDEQIATLNADRAAGLAQDATGCSDTSRVLIELLARRDAHGKAKYGTSLDRTDLSLVDWLQHQTEELLDGAGYAQAAKREAERLLRVEAPLRKLIEGLQESPPRIHNPSLRTLVDLLQ